MIKRIELLVHVGAATTRKDDDRYRALAEAYGSFQSAAICPLSRAAQAGDDGNAEDASRIHSEQQRTHGSVLSPQIYLDDEQLAYTALDSQLLTSSLLRSHPDASPTRAQIPILSSQSNQKRKRTSQSSGPPSSQGNSVGDLEPNVREDGSTRDILIHGPGSTTSSYLKSPELNRARKKAKGNFQPMKVPATPIIPHGDRSNTAPPTTERREFLHVPAGNDEPRARQEDSAGENQTTSELPTSYSLSDITSGSSRARPNISQRSASDPDPQMGSISPTALRAVPTPRKAQVRSQEQHPSAKSIDGHLPDSGPGPCNDKRQLHTDADDSNIKLPVPGHTSTTPAHGVPEVSKLKVSAPRGALATEREVQAAPDEGQLDVLRNLPLSIQAPEPRSTVKKFESHITDPLRMFADNVDVNKAYNPLSMTRDLLPLERGYWLVQCPENSEAWPLQAQVKFWRFLERTVGKGHAGWGVWCIRNDDEGTVDDQQASLGTVKVFCWGEIVMHVYLLLYVASISKVKKLGLQWIDAEGKVVVQMRGPPINV